MASQQAQRRGKKQQQPAVTVAETTGSRAEGVDAQLGQAQQVNEKNRATAAALHSQWKNHLLRLSYLVLLLTLHQFQMPMMRCLTDVKTYNNSLTPLDDATLSISYLQAMWYMCQECVAEIMAVVMSGLLSLFLIQTYKDSEIVIVNAETGMIANRKTFFSHPLYMVTTCLFVPTINIYLHRSKSSQTCLEFYPPARDDAFFMQQLLQPTKGEDDADVEERSRGFPVILVFHGIATVCLWFMNMQQSQQERNAQMLQKLKQDLVQARSKNKPSSKKTS